MIEPIVINKGEGVELELHYQNEDGTDIDLTNMSCTISESHPVELSAGVLTSLAPATGKMILRLTPTQAGHMAAGPVSWLRVALLFDGDVLDVSPKVWFDVQ